METEPMATAEQAIVKRGADVAVPPDDKQCRALDGDERCGENVTFDMDGNYWAIFCVKHLNADKKARKSKNPRVPRLRE